MTPNCAHGSDPLLPCSASFGVLIFVLDFVKYIFDYISLLKNLGISTLSKNAQNIENHVS